MTIFKKYLFGLFVISLFLSAEVHSAQEARIVADDTVIFDAPATNSAPLVRLNRGDIVRISNRHKSGWFHVALPVQMGERRFGWVQSANVEPDTTSRDLRAAGIAVGEIYSRQSNIKNFAIVAYYSGTYPRPASLAQAIGGPSESLVGQTFGGGLGWRFSDYWGAIFRIERHQFSHDLTVNAVETSYQAKGTLISLLFDYTAHYFRPWRLGIQLGGGVSVGNTLSAGFIRTTTIRGRTTTAAFDEASASYLMPTAVAQLAGRYYLGADVAIGVDLGYRYLSKAGVQLADVAVNSNLSGPFVGACFQFEL